MRDGRLCFLAIKLWTWCLSLSLPVSRSSMDAHSHLKCLIVGNLPLIKWVINLRRILVLLPVYNIDLLALASSYAPSPSGKVLITSRVNLLHLLLIGILSSSYLPLRLVGVPAKECHKHSDSEHDGVDTYREFKRINELRSSALYIRCHVKLCQLKNPYGVINHNRYTKYCENKVDSLHNIASLVKIMESCIMCYNTTYKLPPMVIVALGGLEPPRQLPASRPQIYCACQLHHSAEVIAEGTDYIQEGGLPSAILQNKHTPKHGYLSSVICGNNDTDGIINSEVSEADMARLVRICPSCRSRRMKKYDIYRYGGTSRTRYRCENCGKLTIYPLMKLVAERKKK